MKKLNSRVVEDNEGHIQTAVSEIDVRVKNILNGIKRIAIIDDTPDNLKAGRDALKEIFPSAEVVEFSSAGEILRILKTGTSDIDLIFTDMAMEKETSGYDVSCEAWAWRIPCIPVSGGFKTHTTDQVVSKFGFFYGEKDDKTIWLKIIKAMISINYHSNVVLKALYYGKSSTPDYQNGKIGAIVFCSNIFINT